MTIPESRHSGIRQHRSFSLNTEPMSSDLAKRTLNYIGEENQPKIIHPFPMDICSLRSRKLVSAGVIAHDATGQRGAELFFEFRDHCIIYFLIMILIFTIRTINWKDILDLLKDNMLNIQLPSSSSPSYTVNGEMRGRSSMTVSVRLTFLVRQLIVPVARCTMIVKTGRYHEWSSAMER